LSDILPHQSEIMSERFLHEMTVFVPAAPVFEEQLRHTAIVTGETGVGRNSRAGFLMTPKAVEPVLDFGVSKVGGGRPFGGGASDKSMRLARKKQARP